MPIVLYGVVTEELRRYIFPTHTIYYSLTIYGLLICHLIVHPSQCCSVESLTYFVVDVVLSYMSEALT